MEKGGHAQTMMPAETGKIITAGAVAAGVSLIKSQELKVRLELTGWFFGGFPDE